MALVLYVCVCDVVQEKITKKIECSLMVVCSNNIVLCMVSQHHILLYLT